jgi:uncharacterized protein (TIGR02284 family)
MTGTSASLSELVSCLNDGVAFYQRAARKVTDPALVDLFERMARLKGEIAAELNAAIAGEGAPAVESGSVLGALRIAYADVLGALGDHNAATYVARLEQHEDRLLHAFREAVLGGTSHTVRALALRYYPEVEKMHAEMSALKKGLA